MKEESERVVKAATQLIKNATKQFEGETESYSTVNDNFSGERICTRASKGIYKAIKESVKSPIKLTTINQALFSSAQTHCHYT